MHSCITSMLKKKILSKGKKETRYYLEFLIVQLVLDFLVVLL